MAVVDGEPEDDVSEDSRPQHLYQLVLWGEYQERRLSLIEAHLVRMEQRLKAGGPGGDHSEGG